MLDYQYEQTNKRKRNHFQLRKNTRTFMSTEQEIRENVHRLNSIIYNRSRFKRTNRQQDTNNQTRIFQASNKSKSLKANTNSSVSFMSNSPVLTQNLSGVNRTHRRLKSSIKTSIKCKSHSKEESPKILKIKSRPSICSIKNVIKKINIPQNSIKNEQKAVKVLGIVFAVFFIAWMPFAITNILSTFVEIDVKLVDIFTWLGYVSSCINPLIYNAFNENFRKAFKDILTCNFNVNNSKTKSINLYSLIQKEKSSKVSKTYESGVKEAQA